MSQSIPNDINPATTSGSDLAALLNGFKDAIASGFSGTSRPTNLQAGGYWVDTTNDPTSWSIMFYDGNNDVELFFIDLNTGVASVSSAGDLLELIKDSDDTLSGTLKFLKSRTTGNQSLIDDELGTVEFYGTDTVGTERLQTRLKVVSTDDTTITELGSYISLEMSDTNSASFSEVLRVVDSKLALGLTDPTASLHIVGENIRSERVVESSEASRLILDKSRPSNGGQVQSSDGIGKIEIISSDQTSSKFEAAMIEAVALETHTDLVRGTKLTFMTVEEGGTTLATRMEVGDNVSITGGLTVEGDLTVNGTTTTVNTDSLDVEDANITVNKNGDEASADLADAGLTVEMSDATDVTIGFDSTLATKFKIGEVGSEAEVASVSHTQTFTNKTINADNNTITNLEVDNLKSGVLDTDLSTVSASDDTIPSAKAVKSYVDTTVVDTLGSGDTEIDWSAAEIFYEDLSVNKTFTFANAVAGQTIIMVLENDSGSARTVTLPTVKWPAGTAVTNIDDGTTAVFTIIFVGGSYFVAAVEGLQ